MDSSIARRTRRAQEAMWRQQYFKIRHRKQEENPTGLHDTKCGILHKKQDKNDNEIHDTECSDQKPLSSSETIPEKNVSPIQNRKRGRPRRCEHQLEERMLEIGTKEVHEKSGEWLKKHNKQIALDEEARSYIQELVKLEVKKQLMELIKLSEAKGHEVTGGENGGKKSPISVSSTEMKEPAAELCLGKDVELQNLFEKIVGESGQESGIESTKRNESVTKQWSENQQMDKYGSYTEFKKGTEEDQGNNFKEANKQGMGTVSVGEEIDLPFQDAFLHTQDIPETPAKQDNVCEFVRLYAKDVLDDADCVRKVEGLTVQGETPNSGSKDHIVTSERKNIQTVKHAKDEEAEKKLRQSSVVTQKPNKPIKDTYVSMEMEETIVGNNDIDSNRGPMKRSRVHTQDTKSPFMCVLEDIENEVQKPVKLENVYQNKKESEEDGYLEDMWRDMDLALEGSTLNSGTMMNCNNTNDFSEAEMDMHSMYCMCEHVFVLDEEIGIICNVCKFVKQEISTILPPFIVDTGRKESRNDYLDEEDVSYIQDPYVKIESNHLSTDFLSPSKHSVWNLIPSLKENMYPHQQEAFEFLWRNLGGGLTLENLQLPTSDNVGGCIISHAPGTGKSFLVISFLRSYLELFPRSRPLIVAPFTMLFPWEKEFRKWGIDFPVYILNRSKTFWQEIDSNYEYAEIIKLVNSGQIKGKNLKNLRRLVMLYEWHRRKSVLAVSYNLFVSLTCDENRSKSEENDHIGKLLLESPGLLILDEGHQARNSRSKVWNALKKVNTKLRIILSGTLFQNNFKELFNTLYLVRPTFVDCFLGENSMQSSSPSKLEGNGRIHRTSEDYENRLRKFFMDEIGNKIENGKEEFDETLAKFRLMTDAFVHCYDGKILRSLPGLRDFAVILRPSYIQRTVLDQINEANNLHRVSNFEFETMVSCVSIHPSLYREFGLKRLSSSISYPGLEATRKDPCEGVKTKFVLDLVQLSRVLEEKVLLFSQNIPPLVLLMEMFENRFSWRKGKDFCLLDGTLSLDERQSIIDQFNDPKGDACVLCASIKTCSEGITLTGASRVVFLDLVWNPAIVKQALSRAFRLGQKKHVYIYRLLASGTMEEEKYQRTVWKDCLSTLVFVSPNDEENVNVGESTQTIHCEDKILDKLVELDRETKIFHTIFEHSECLQGYQNSKDKQHIHIP